MMEDKRKKFKRKVSLKIIQIFLILIFVFTISFIFAGKINKESKDLINKRTAVQTILARNQAKAGMYKEYESAKPYIKELENIHFWVAKEDLIKIISLLEKTAQNTGNSQVIQLKDSQPAPDISALGVEVEKMNYMITLSGTLDSLLEYAKKIKELPYYIKIDYINAYDAVDLEKSSQTVLGASFYIKK